MLSARGPAEPATPSASPHIAYKSLVAPLGHMALLTGWANEAVLGEPTWPRSPACKRQGCSLNLALGTTWH